MTSLALRGEYRLDDRWLVRAALLDGVPGDPVHPKRTAIQLSRSDGALVVAEVNYLTARTKAAVGIWRYTARFPAIERAGEPLPAGAHSGGAYLLVEQRFTRAHAEQGERGLAAYIRVGMADDTTNPIARYMGGGLVYTGLLRAKGDDRLGLTFARAEFGRPYRRAAAAAGAPSDRAETIVEATYRTPLADWLAVQPDVMYVVDPGGVPAVRDALVIGLRLEVGF